MMDEFFKLQLISLTKDVAELKAKVEELSNRHKQECEEIQMTDEINGVPRELCLRTINMLQCYVDALASMVLPDNDEGDYRRRATEAQRLRVSATILEHKALLAAQQPKPAAAQASKLPDYILLSKEMKDDGDRAALRAREDGCASVDVLRAVFFEAAIQRWLNDQVDAE